MAASLAFLQHSLRERSRVIPGASLSPLRATRRLLQGVAPRASHQLHPPGGDYLTFLRKVKLATSPGFGRSLRQP